MSCRQPRNYISQLEQSLGWKWSEGVYKSGKLRDIPQLKALLGEVHDLKYTFACDTPEGVRTSTRLWDESRAILAKHGPTVWPDSSVDRQDWLLDAEIDDAEGRYRKDLYYSDERDREVSVLVPFGQGVIANIAKSARPLLPPCARKGPSYSSKSEIRREGKEGKESKEGKEGQEDLEARRLHRQLPKYLRRPWSPVLSPSLASTGTRMQTMTNNPQSLYTDRIPHQNQ